MVLKVEGEVSEQRPDRRAEGVKLFQETVLFVS